MYGVVNVDVPIEGVVYGFAINVNEKGQTYNIKIIDDVTVLQIGNSQFILCVPGDLDNSKISTCAAYVTSCSSSGSITVNFRNITKATSLLTTPLTIDVSKYTSYTSTIPYIINTSFNTVSTGDLIAVDVSTSGTNAKGFGVIFNFSPI